MKKCPTSSAIKEMQAKSGSRSKNTFLASMKPEFKPQCHWKKKKPNNTLKFHLTLVRMAIIKNKNNICW
jgi:hypothetical protein